MTFDELTVPRGADHVVAVAGAADEAVIQAVKASGNSGVRFILLGAADDIRRIAGECGADLAGAEVLDQSGDEEALCRRAAEICAAGEAGVLMKGLVGTAAFSRAVLDKTIRLTPPGSLLSHVAAFEHPQTQRVFFLTDAAINIQPDLEEKKRILENAVSTARAAGFHAPSVAVLAPVEKVNPKIPSTVDARALCDWARTGSLGDAVVGGPFALDVALSSEAAELKNVSSPAAGDADILLVPNLDAGNVLYKSLSVVARADRKSVV